MRQTVLITGAAGFAGGYMASCLQDLEADMIIVGVDLHSPTDNPCERFYTLDLSDSNSVAEMIKKERPDWIIHLAGIFGSENIPLTYQVNVLSTVALLESVRQYVPQSVFLAAGSAAEYGRVGSEKMPIREDGPCRPVTPYGQSKYLATSTIQYYHRVHNLCTMVVRPFQLIGRGVTDKLAPGAFAKRIMEAVQAGKTEIQVGNLESSRDFLDIHDAVRAIWMLCRHPKAGEIFNVCSSKPVRMGDLLDSMITVASQELRPVMDPSRLRGKADVNAVYGSYIKIKDHCGWEPTTGLIQSIREMFA